MNTAPTPCPNANFMAEHACANRRQCWEPCGDLGKSEEHAVVNPTSEPGIVLLMGATMESSLEPARVYQDPSKELWVRLGQSVAPQAFTPPSWLPTHRHYKGGWYQELFRARMDTDQSRVVIYRGEDGRNWIRPADEFEGKFERL